MQSALNEQTQNDTNLVTAEALREMTISKEALLKNQKRGIIDTLMSTMVRIATEQGGNGYTANFDPKFNPTLLAEITENLESLGYKVVTEAKSDEKSIASISVTINW